MHIQTVMMENYVDKWISHEQRKENRVKSCVAERIEVYALAYLAHTSRNHMTHESFFDGGFIDASTVHGIAHSVGSETRGGHCRQCHQIPVLYVRNMTRSQCILMYTAPH